MAGPAATLVAPFVISLIIINYLNKIFNKKTELININSVSILYTIQTSSVQKSASKSYFTSSLNFLPAEKAGTVFAAIFKGAPV